jgi:RNase H-fold protein (predicted Holliday junction resolvase)|tara:strand:+ start:1738 stop:1998 length:261 start_codon:yes stop_codon:yes gene_type:complete
MKKLQKKRSKQTILDEFGKSMKRDKSKDIIVGNPFKKNDKFQKEMFNNMFYEKLRDFFSNYLLNMNKDERDYLDERSKNIKVRKMF